MLKLGGVADPLWNALDHGELDYKQVWKVVSRYKRTMKKKGAPTTGGDLILKLLSEVKIPAPDSSPISSESVDDAPGVLDCPLNSTKPAIQEPLVPIGGGPKRTLRLNTVKTYEVPTPITLPSIPFPILPIDAGLSTFTTPRTVKEAEAEGRALATHLVRRAIRREIVLTYADLHNKPLNNRQLVTAIAKHLPKAHHPDIIDERDQMIQEGIITPALKKGAYILDKNLVFEVNSMLDSKIKEMTS
jgi:hypothetical protein